MNKPVFSKRKVECIIDHAVNSSFHEALRTIEGMPPSAKNLATVENKSTRAPFVCKHPAITKLEEDTSPSPKKLATVEKKSASAPIDCNASTLSKLEEDISPSAKKLATAEKTSVSAPIVCNVSALTKLEENTIPSAMKPATVTKQSVSAAIYCNEYHATSIGIARTPDLSAIKNSIVSHKRWHWHQNGDEVQIRIPLDALATKKDITVKFKATTLSVKVRGETYIDGALGGKVEADECIWCLSPDKIELQVMLTKVEGKTKDWPFFLDTQFKNISCWKCSDTTVSSLEKIDGVFAFICHECNSRLEHGRDSVLEFEKYPNSVGSFPED